MTFEPQFTDDEYLELTAALKTVPRPEAPPDFTASLLARLPTEPAPISHHDLAAVVLVTGAALVAAVLFSRGDGATYLFELVRNLPGLALTEALVAVSLHGGNQTSLLLFLSAATLLIGTALWRVVSVSKSAVA
jgi:hypothetical protein